MKDGVADAVEEFLVEDVLLGLGNIRNTLAEVAAAEARGEPPPLLHLAQIAGHIDRLERRARSLQGLLRPAPDPAVTAHRGRGAAAADPGPVFASRRRGSPAAGPAQDPAAGPSEAGTAAPPGRTGRGWTH